MKHFSLINYEKKMYILKLINIPVTVSTVSTLSPPTELLTTHKYLPESSTLASRIIKVPDTCLILSSNVTACFLFVPSRNLYHLHVNYSHYSKTFVISIYFRNVTLIKNELIYNTCI